MKDPSQPALSRFTGCLLGGAVGDALGYPIEFVTSVSQILGTHGVSAPSQLAYAGKPALISDDTQMTLFTAEGLIRGKQRANERGICDLTGCLQRAYLRWYETQQTDHATAPTRDGWLIQEKGLWARRAPGNTCMSVLARGEAFRGDRDHRPNDSKGCGAVMRAAPIGLAAPTIEWAFELARDSALLTHGHPSGYLSAAYFSAIIFELAHDRSLAQAMKRADGLLRRESGHEEMAGVVERVRDLASANQVSPGAIESLGGGWVGEEALGIALLCALTTSTASPSDFAATLWRSVAHGGDSDSTGSITGNLLGAMFGQDYLPPTWLSQLELRDVIDRVAKDLHTVCIQGESLDHRDYPPN